MFSTHLSNLNLTLALERRGQGLSRTLVFFLSDVQLCMLYWIRILCLQTSRSMIPFEKTKMSRCTFIFLLFFQPGYIQSHYREVAPWEIFMEQELRFGLDLGRFGNF